MKKTLLEISAVVFSLLALASSLASQTRHPPRHTIAGPGVPTCDASRDGDIVSITDASIAADDCSTAGTDTIACQCESGVGWGVIGGGSVSQAYETIEDEGSPLTQRSTVNFIGAIVTCADNATKTDCTFTAHDGVGYEIVEDEGSPLTQRDTVNFTGAGVSCVDVGGITVCTISGGGGGTITVREVDLSPSVSNVDTLEFAEADGFVVSDETGGVARVANPSVPLSTGRSSETTIRGLATDPGSDDEALIIQGSGDTSNNTNNAIVAANLFRYFTVAPEVSSTRDGGIGFIMGTRDPDAATTYSPVLGFYGSTTAAGVPTNPSLGIWTTQHIPTASLQKSRFAMRFFGEDNWTTFFSGVAEYNANGGDHLSLDAETWCIGSGCGDAWDLTDDEAHIKANIIVDGRGSDPSLGMPTDSSPPGSCSAGEVVYDTTTDCLKVCANGGTFACI